MISFLVAFIYSLGTKIFFNHFSFLFLFSSLELFILQFFLEMYVYIILPLLYLKKLFSEMLKS